MPLPLPNQDLALADAIFADTCSEPSSRQGNLCKFSADWAMRTNAGSENDLDRQNSPYIWAMHARYRFNAEKALIAIHYMAATSRDLDLHTALKAIYFSDKSHLNAFQQPIFGATYKAMKYGPVPLEVYEMIKGESLWLSELQITAMPWKLEGFRIKLASNEPVTLDLLADSEREHFEAGFQKSRQMTFNDRTAQTHGPDWQAANLGEMRYEDMVEPGPDRAAIIDFIKENARHTRL